jgi:protein-S-isoprenylcysteine O-methyltransferase Ste14
MGVEVILHASIHAFDFAPERVEIAFLHLQSVKILGAVLACIGLFIFVLAFFSFGDSWRIGIDRKTAGQLVTGGIFSVSRNPIYVAFDLLFIACLSDERHMVLSNFRIPGDLRRHMQTLREEKFLAQRYGEDTRAIAKQTPRLF